MDIVPTKNDRITHYIPQNYAPIVREFVEPSPEPYFIHWLFRYRCMECKRPGQEINEIVPRSRSKSAIMDWRNRVLLCRECHTKFHHNGVTKEKIEAMQKLRSEYLTSVGRGEYVGR